MYAAGESKDEVALKPARTPASQDVERRVSTLLSKMTTEEKLQQVQLLSDGQVTDADAKAGVGGVFSLVNPQRINELQHIAVEQSRLGIPILFAYDTIHGYRTIFPIPLATGSSFDPDVASEDHRFGARESAAVGLKQIYSPMVDVSHEPRWGRISEAAGEDPYLNSVMAAARVKAAQGRDYSAKDKVVTSVKHYAAYGQPEGGRDYGTTDMSEQRLRNLLPAAVQGRHRRGLGHGDVLVQRHQRRPGLREQAARDRHPQERVELGRLHRERLHRRRGAAQPWRRPSRAPTPAPRR